jgi:site-specific DNA-methyltransferase (adenine-specific)
LTHTEGHPAGRYPANVLHDGSDEVLEAFAGFGGKGGGFGVRGSNALGLVNDGGWKPKAEGQEVGFGDTGTAARFFYCAKASKAERGEGNTHPTVKPVALMRWLVRLVCPPGGTVLDPFAGSGSTALAAMKEGRRCVGIERHPPYAEIARKRVRDVMAPTEVSA